LPNFCPTTFAQLSYHARRQRLVFWLVAVPVALLLAFPWYASLLF
jgi:hypothetical protein